MPFQWCDCIWSSPTDGSCPTLTVASPVCQYHGLSSQWHQRNEKIRRDEAIARAMERHP